MGPVLPTGSAPALTEALDVLVQRGTITADQRSAILAEVVAAEGAERPSDAAEPPNRGRRPLSGVLIEIGLYVGAVLVLAAGFVLVAQNWQAMSLGVQIGLTAVTALAAGTVATVVGHGALPNSPRRRLSGALFVAAAASAAGATALMVDNASSDYTGLAAFAVAFAVLLGAHLLSPSAITELGIFGAGLGLIQGALEVLRPDVPEYLDRTSTFEQYAPMAIVTFAVVWALLVSRRLAHRELAVFAGCSSP